MNVVRRINRESIGSKSSNAPSTHSTTVSMYTDAPSFELTLDEFEEYALARLKVLRKIEDMRARNFPHDKFRSELDSAMQTLKDSKVDLASHFILRAAYCRSEDLRRWFLQQESALFKHRLNIASQTNTSILAKLLNKANTDNEGGVKYQRVSEADKQNLRDKLQAAGSTANKSVSIIEFRDTAFYKIPFSQALELVSSRQVYVHKGYAYVPTQKLVSTITARFRSQVSGSLVRASAAFDDAIAGDEGRIGPLLKNMNQTYTGKDYSQAKVVGDINPQNVDDLAKRSMPLCMRQLQRGLKQDHKLKHWGRMQYGLFLKGAGLSMEDSLVFFQAEFTRIMNVDQFQKQYSYNIRHMYGKEGKRKSYTPYNCTKIIMGNPPQSGDHHGCPFRHYDDDHLSALLSSLNLKGPDKEAIMQHKKTKNYNLACVKHFEATHPGALSVPGIQLDGVGNHPNAWFQASTSYFALKEGKNQTLTQDPMTTAEENNAVGLVSSTSVEAN
mmetsp:Transcript_14158/g.21751  ORF Transcript_14158/g.21751 Transcript_14158/m.21751 type:complete len:499 (-) Transcript_14158:21-1517(-)